MPAPSIHFRWKFFAILLLALSGSLYHEHYKGDFTRTIHIDGIGYNAYLPALFIHDGNLSWNFFETDLKKMNLFEGRLQDFRKPVGNAYVNKYPLGLAITQAPLWLATHASYGFSKNISGYERPFQTAVFLNNLFWLFIGLWFFSKFLLENNWSPNRVLIVVILILFGTNLFHFITFDNSLTHPVTLGITMISFFCLDRYMQTERWKYLIVFILLCALIFWIRPVNAIMVLFFISYFLFSGKKHPKIGIPLITIALIGAALAILVYSGSLFLQTGKWFVYTYQNERFVFNEWHITDVLFGYRCGLFLYTPIALFALLLGLLNPNRKLVISFLASMAIAVWIVSTWNEYCYGCRLGNRPMIDYFAFFVIPLTGINWNFRKYSRALILVFLIFCLYYNQILHYQYRHYLLDWCWVKKEQFWQVFMRTNR